MTEATVSNNYINYSTPKGYKRVKITETTYDEKGNIIKTVETVTEEPVNNGYQLPEVYKDVMPHVPTYPYPSQPFITCDTGESISGIKTYTC